MTPLCAIPIPSNTEHSVMTITVSKSADEYIPAYGGYTEQGEECPIIHMKDDEWMWIRFDEYLSTGEVLIGDWIIGRMFLGLFYRKECL